MIHQYAPHHVRCDTEKLGAIVPVGITLIDKAEVRLVNQRRGLKSMTVSLAAHRMSRDTAQLIVHERDELVGRSRVALTPRREQRGDVRPCWLRKV
jgi:hypothetical protein